ncbi:MAG: 4Fe-4S dicluster domain-containing protein [Thermincolia bacterium]
MKVSINTQEGGRDFLRLVEAESGQNIRECYQCGKCSGGCPFAQTMDYAPNQILEMINYGLEESLLESKAIQMCIGCATCEANCPSGFAMHEVMHALRKLAKVKGVATREKLIPLFNKMFLDTVQENGRLHEIGLILKFNYAQQQLLKDTGLGPKMFIKGMMDFGDVFPHRIKGVDAVKKIFDNVQKMGGDSK